MNNRLFAKIYGCEAAGTIGNSMGDVTEGLLWHEIEEKYGFVTELLPQEKKGSVVSGNDDKTTEGQPLGPKLIYHPHTRPPGMTEDGMERHRLCTSAILRKGGRIDIVDLARTWISDIDPEKFGYLLGPQDQVIYYSLKAGVPPWEVGRYAAWPGMIGTSKMIMPIGMVNACNPEQAAQDALALGAIKDVRGVPGNYAIEVCSAIAAATAEALKPTASVDSIIDAALGYLSGPPRQEVEMGLQWAKQVDDWKELRPIYDRYYAGKRMSNAVEILSGGLACFYVSEGRPKEALLYAVNLGRDTDCKAYIAGGLAGALRGIEAIPADWVKTVEEAAANDPYTVSRRTAKEAAEGLYAAALNTHQKLKDVIGSIDQQL
ncbi:ADP-ribosylglycohydrolase family protein [Paenibacillus sp.]|uniref:ADP-ribosylglycohydrolase family protein n=1 Tax=Paenibacillus sp. TaxID=58172 RepID=UPI002D3C0BD0|nr:ADP-ribosylglycohydrolase family protein [Paenibacillus sp.]HZG87867.1 ADP-ribosylglycohydrolase family protein [Paenibacillus sp.]